MELETGVGSVIQTDSRLIQTMISGLEELPELGSKIVRIFTSSTFTGWGLTRQALSWQTPLVS